MTTDTPLLRARADVTTDRPDRWLKQLASHLGRKATVTELDDATVLGIGTGSCTLRAGDDVLSFAAEAPDEESLARVQQVVGGHFERFAAKEGLTVDWQSQA